MSDIELPPNRGPRLLHSSELKTDKGLKKFVPGDVVFFKRVKETAQSHGRFQEFKGHGFGILLGSVPLLAPDPPQSFLVALMGHHGWAAFDDVAEALGVESCQKVLAHITKKYYAPEPPKVTVLTEPVPPT